MLQNSKSHILRTLGSQIDTLKHINGQEEQNEVFFFIFFPKCRKKHHLRECPLDNIYVCGICVERHLTENCLKIVELKATNKKESEAA